MVDPVVDIAGFEKGILQLVKAMGDKAGVTKDLDLLAEEILRRAIDSPIPSDDRQLANSASTFPEPNKTRVVFGFNRVYAAFQDAPGRTNAYIVRPRLKKILYIPISRKGRFHRRGLNPKNEGLVRGRDFVLAKKAVIPIKPYGSTTGPNHYFSQTIAKNKEFIFKQTALIVERRFKKAVEDVARRFRKSQGPTS